MATSNCLPGLVILLSVLLSGCSTRGYITSAVSTVVGLDVSENPKTQMPHVRFGYVRGQYNYIPTDKVAGEATGESGSAKDAPNLVSNLLLKTKFLSDMTISEQFAVGDRAVGTAAAENAFGAAAPVQALADTPAASQIPEVVKFRPTSLQEISAPRHGVILQKVQPPGAGGPKAEPLPSPEKPAGAGAAKKSRAQSNPSAVKIPPEFQGRNDNLRWAFTSLTEADAGNILEGKQFPPPRGARELLAKDILADASLPLLPSSTAVQSLEYFREHASDDQSLKRLEAAYQKNLPNFKP